jgi:hypothetical protein
MDAEEEAALARAIEESRRDVEEALLSSPVMSGRRWADFTPMVEPRATQNLTLRQEQDLEFEASLAVDRERQRREALKAKKEAEERELIERAKADHQYLLDNLLPPVLTPIQQGITFRVRSRNKPVLTYTMDKNESFGNLVQQIRYDLRTLEGLTLTIYPNKILTCPMNTSLVTCGITNRTVIDLDLS